MIREIRGIKKSSEEFDCEIAISEVAVDQGSPHLFTVVIRDITERKRAQAAEAEARANAARIEQLERELRSFEQLSSPPQTAVTAQLFGLAPLHKGLPDTFNELVQRYGDLIDLALEQRAYKVEHNISEGLQSIAEQLGFLKAGPRDVVQIHSTASRSTAITPQGLEERPRGIED